MRIRGGGGCALLLLFVMCVCVWLAGGWFGLVWFGLVSLSCLGRWCSFGLRKKEIKVGRNEVYSGARS